VKVVFLFIYISSRFVSVHLTRWRLLLLLFDAG
jgi:hypothetical protein